MGKSSKPKKKEKKRPASTEGGDVSIDAAAHDAPGALPPIALPRTSTSSRPSASETGLDVTPPSQSRKLATDLGAHGAEVLYGSPELPGHAMAAVIEAQHEGRNPLSGGFPTEEPFGASFHADPAGKKAAQVSKGGVTEQAEKLNVKDLISATAGDVRPPCVCVCVCVCVHVCL